MKTFIIFLFLILSSSKVFSGQVGSSSAPFDSIQLKGKSISLLAEISNPEGKFTVLDILINGKKIILDWKDLATLERVDLNSTDVKYAGGCFFEGDGETCYFGYTVQFVYGKGCDNDGDYGQLVYSIHYNLTSKESSFESNCFEY